MNNRKINIIVRFKSKIHMYSLFLTIITSFLEKEDDALIKCSIYNIREKFRNSPKKKKLFKVSYFISFLKEVGISVLNTFFLLSLGSINSILY